jgi:hypothetical protein
MTPKAAWHHILELKECFTILRSRGLMDANTREITYTDSQTGHYNLILGDHCRDLEENIRYFRGEKGNNVYLELYRVVR